MRVSVIIPVYNEIGTIKEIVSRVQAVPLEKEIIPDQKLEKSRMLIIETER
jgi:hypothetical protein